MSYKDIYQLSEISMAASRFIKHFSKYKIFAFYGEMGVGKTTFIKAICKELEVIDLTNSPSFAIVNEYKREKSGEVYHIDFYRIKKEEEIFDLGYEEYLYSGQYCFIEWPECVEHMLPGKTISIIMTKSTANSRQIKLKENYSI